MKSAAAKPPALVPTGAQHARAIEGPLGAVEDVAAVLQTQPGDLSWVPYAATGVMWMRRSAQLDDEAELNGNAMIILRKMGHDGLSKMAVRGPAVVFPSGVPWGPLEGDLRGVALS